jgi:nitrate/nitrite transport system substrate-binding protein
MLDADIDDAAVAASVNQTALYRDAAQAAGIATPGERRAATFCDGRVWDGGDPARYLAGFEMRA